MPKPNTWRQFAAEVLQLYAPPLRRIATQRKMRTVLGELAQLCRRPADLTPAAIAAWIAAHPDRRPETVESYLRSLRAACVYGIHAKILDTNPFDFRKPAAWVDWDVPELPPPVHSAAAIARVLAKADLEAQDGPWRAQRLRAVIYAFAFTGARRREILGLPVRDVDLAGGAITIATNGRRTLKCQSAAARVPIAAPLGAVLETWLPLCGSAWLFPGVRRRAPWLEGPPGEKALDQVKALGLRAGVPGLTFQSFRHTFASLAESWGLGELALQRVLRHSSPRMQRGYRHPLPELLRAAGAKVHYP